MNLDILQAKDLHQSTRVKLFDKRKHFRLYPPQCAICLDTISKYEETIAMLGSSSRYSGCTRRFHFPPPWNVVRVDGFQPCTDPNCTECDHSPESLLIHYDCFRAFAEGCTTTFSKSLPDLWMIAAFTSPWQKAPIVYFDKIRPLDHDSLKLMSLAYGLLPLYKLPPELRDIIRDYSRDAFLWRIVSAFGVATRVSTADPAPLLTTPVCNILSWRRGEEPKLVSSQTEPPVMMLTIDVEGIVSIERLAYQPNYSGKSSKHLAFIVEQEKSMLGVRAHFKGGLMRLEVPPGRRCPRIWNTSAPPDMSLSGILTEASWQRCFVVELNRITGITFFFSSNRIVGVHTHDSREPCALSTYQRIFEGRDHNLVWVYLPILEDNPLLALDICQSSLPDGSRQFYMEALGTTSDQWETFRSMDCILAITKKAGEIALGPQHVETTQRYHAGGPPKTFVYSDTFGGHPLSVLGTYYYKQSSQFPMEYPTPHFCPIGEPAYFSQAPLDGVSSIQVFYITIREFCEFIEFCTGMIFKYRNGGCRAVGQCRINIDLTKQITEPNWICYRNNLRRQACYEPKIYMPQVAFEHDYPVYGRETVDAWGLRPLRGQLRFWFTDQSSFISIDDT